MFLIGSINMIFEQLLFLVILSCCCISWQQFFHTLCFVIQIKPAYVIPDQVCCAVIRYHSRRVTCLEFHPTKNNILLSGDKVRLMLCIVVDTSFFYKDALFHYNCPTLHLSPFSAFFFFFFFFFFFWVC